MKDLLNTPLKNLTPAELQTALAEREAQLSAIARANEDYEMQNRAGLHVITDSCEVKSMVDGKVYTSKSRYYDSLKAHDCRIVEPGEYNPEKPHKDRLTKADLDCSKELRAAIRQHLK